MYQGKGRTSGGSWRIKDDDEGGGVGRTGRKEKYLEESVTVEWIKVNI